VACCSDGSSRTCYEIMVSPATFLRRFPASEDPASLDNETPQAPSHPSRESPGRLILDCYRRARVSPMYKRSCTAVLSKIPHSNCCKRVPNRPLRHLRGRFGTLLEQLECGIFERTAVARLSKGTDYRGTWRSVVHQDVQRRTASIIVSFQCTAIDELAPVTCSSGSLLFFMAALGRMGRPQAGLDAATAVCRRCSQAASDLLCVGTPARKGRPKVPMDFCLDRRQKWKGVIPRRRLASRCATWCRQDAKVSAS